MPADAPTAAACALAALRREIPGPSADVIAAWRLCGRLRFKLPTLRRAVAAQLTVLERHVRDVEQELATRDGPAA